MNAVYLCFERFVVPSKFRLTPGRDSLLQSGAAGGFSTSSADIIYMNGCEEDVAGYLSTAQKILPIVPSPVLGLAIDSYGHRFHYVAAAPILWIIACSLLGFTNVHPTAALVLSSLAGVINSMPLQICIPLLVADQAKIGTAFGVWRAFNNSGSTIMDVVFGVLQDATENNGYYRVLLVALGIKAWAFVLGVVYIVVDYRLLGKGMTMTRLQREAVIVDREADPLTHRSSKPWFTALAFGLLISIVASAWAVFLRYLV
ncbi:hypothetical protein ACJ41O_001546 [Fusarium nematophilum]